MLLSRVSVSLGLGCVEITVAYTAVVQTLFVVCIVLDGRIHNLHISIFQEQPVGHNIGFLSSIGNRPFTLDFSSAGLSAA